MLVSSCHRPVWENAYHDTKLQPSDKNISTHTRLNFKSSHEVNLKFKHFCCFLRIVLYKRKPSYVAKLCVSVCCIVQTLYTIVAVPRFLIKYNEVHTGNASHFV